MHDTVVEIFEWLFKNSSMAKYDLAGSNIRGISYAEYKKLANLEIHNDFDLGLTKAMGEATIIEWLTKKYRCSSDMVVTTTGASEANFIVFASHLRKGDEIVVERPGYSPMWHAPMMLGAKVRFWDRKFENGFALDVESLKKLANRKTKLIVLTNLHNPSGVATKYESIKAISDIAQEKRAKVLVDEMFLDGAFSPQKSAAGIEPIIVSASISKIYGLSGLRTGWIIADRETASKCFSTKTLTTGSSGRLGDYMTGHILLAASDMIVQRFQKIAKKNFVTVSKWMDIQQDLLDWIVPAGGVICYPKYKGKITSVNFCRRLLKRNGVLLSPGEYFGLDGHFRMTYKNPPTELKGALDELAVGVSKILKNSINVSKS